MFNAKRDAVALVAGLLLTISSIFCAPPVLAAKDTDVVHDVTVNLVDAKGRTAGAAYGVALIKRFSDETISVDDDVSDHTDSGAATVRRIESVEDGRYFAVTYKIGEYVALNLLEVEVKGRDVNLGKVPVAYKPAGRRQVVTVKLLDENKKPWKVTLKTKSQNIDSFAAKLKAEGVPAGSKIGAVAELTLPDGRSRLLVVAPKPDGAKFKVSLKADGQVVLAGVPDGNFLYGLIDAAGFDVEGGVWSLARIRQADVRRTVTLPSQAALAAAEKAAQEETRAQILHEVSVEPVDDLGQDVGGQYGMALVPFGTADLTAVSSRISEDNSSNTIKKVQAKNGHYWAVIMKPSDQFSSFNAVEVSVNDADVALGKVSATYHSAGTHGSLTVKLVDEKGKAYSGSTSRGTLLDEFNRRMSAMNTAAVSKVSLTDGRSYFVVLSPLSARAAADVVTVLGPGGNLTVSNVPDGNYYFGLFTDDRNNGGNGVSVMTIAPVRGGNLAMGSAVIKSRTAANDARRVSDIKQIQTALELHFADAGKYPVAKKAVKLGAATTSSLCVGGFKKTCGQAVTYMNVVPAAPVPVSGACTAANNGYSYSSADGKSYSLTFCLGGQTGEIKAGRHTATPNGIR